MNDKIKLLAEQAGMEDYPDRGINTLYGDKEIQKFTELIVQECIKCSEPLVSHYIDTHTEQEQALLLAAIADYSSEISKHFGVEE